jgi:hypothetical protein
VDVTSVGTHRSLVARTIKCGWAISHVLTTLNIHDIVGYDNFLERTLIFIMKINMGHIKFQTTLNLYYKTITFSIVYN